MTATERDDIGLTTSAVRNVERQLASRPAKILLIEDDLEEAVEIAGDLRERGYRIRLENTGLGGLDAGRDTTLDLLIVDRMLPGIDGLSLIEKLRRDQITTPVLILSALGAVDDRILGLRAGGDDYLTKPFALEEVAARIEALLRRPNDTRETVLRVGPLVLDLIDRQARRGTREIELLPREFMILEYMMRRPGQVITRDMLLEGVWHYRYLPQTNLVDVHMGKLRHKIDQPDEHQLISSVRHAGFRLEGQEPDEPASLG